MDYERKREKRRDIERSRSPPNSAAKRMIVGSLGSSTSYKSSRRNDSPKKISRAILEAEKMTSIKPKLKQLEHN